MSRRHQRRQKVNIPKFEFAIHADETKGPNRVTTDSVRAVRFFEKTKQRGVIDAVCRVRHMPSGLVFETTFLSELNHFIGTVVEHVNSNGQN